MAATLLLLGLAVGAAPAPSAPPAVGAIGNGTCGPTKVGLDCNTAPKGSFPGMKTFGECVTKVKGCKMGNYVAFSLGWNDCSWYSTCDWDHLCADCTKPGPNCPNPATGGCPVYHPWVAEVLYNIGPPAPPAPTPPAPPVPPPPPPPPAPPTVFTLDVNWGAAPITTASTAATVEVDCCEPFLTRDPAAHTHGGGPFASYLSAMKDLGAEFVRFAPWYPYPKVAVVELEPTDCTATTPASNWNSSLFDPILADFMSAVCGEGAATGHCEHSVAQQLSTMPSWLYVGGEDPKDLPADPWDMRMSPYGSQGTALKNESCVDMAAYITRLVAHYTMGGHHDTCGHFHASGLHYNWTVVSVLNENEHNTGAARYTRCWDAIRASVEKVNPSIALEGPETVFDNLASSYSTTFIDPTTHADGRAPDIVSNHAYFPSTAGGADGSGYESLFTEVDKLVEETVKPLAAVRDKVAPATELVLNEWIPFISDWCNTSDAATLFKKHQDNTTHPLLRDELSAGCPDWKDPRSSTIGINRVTLGWSAAAAQFAYGVGQLALYGRYKYVGNDDLACGPYPDNEPAVTGLDWHTGEWNAKAYIVKMLAEHLGAGPKDLLNATVRSLPHTATSPAQAGGGCFMEPKGAVNYKYAPGNVFPNDAKHPHGLRLTSSPAQCCALCQSLKNCTFFTYSGGGTVAKPTCYSTVGKGCCFLKTAEGGDGSPGCPTCTSGSTKPLPAPPALVFALPYILHDAAKTRGLMLINKQHTGVTVKLSAAALAGGTPTALVLEGVGPEPGFNSPVNRSVAGGQLSIGPYGVALVTYCYF